MAKFYFFETSEQDRDGVKKPTLRALPGQTLEDGRPINTDLNVMAPKENKDYDGGSRFEYPYGTIFCSDYLTTITNQGKPFYSVYPDGDLSKKPCFHPVSDDPDFQFVSANHRDDTMNSAYLLFKNGLEPVDVFTNDGNEETGRTMVYQPMDDKGDAISEIPNWKEAYNHQLEDELEMFLIWIKYLVKEQKKVTLPCIIRGSDVKELYEGLYKCGESLDSICSTRRFETCMKEEGITYDTFTEFNKGPHYFYLSYLAREHKLRTKCSAVKRDSSKKSDVEEASLVLCRHHNEIHGGIETYNAEKTLAAVKDALAKGWTISEMVTPENINKKNRYSDYVKALAGGEIPLPEKLKGNEASFIESLMADKKYKKPSTKDGFHVDSKLWKRIVWSYERRLNTCLTGPTGSGKTELVSLLANRAGVKLTSVQMGTIYDPAEQLGGIRDIDTITGGTCFILSDFAKAIQEPGIVLLDELNRIPKNGANMIFSCLDDRRTFYIPGAKSDEQRCIKMHPDCVIFATANIGAEYVGTNVLDPALAKRFEFVQLDFNDIGTEKEILINRTGVDAVSAMNIATVAHELRKLTASKKIDTIVSMRESLRCAQMVKDGFSCQEAMEYNFLDIMDKGEGINDTTSEYYLTKIQISSRFTNTRN